MEKQNIKLPLNLRQPMSKRKNEALQVSLIDFELFTSSFNSEIYFSDEELKKIRKSILSKLEEAKIDYDLLKGALLRHHNRSNDGSPTFKLWEDAAEVFSKEEIAQLAIRLEKFIEKLKNTLINIEEKMYGIPVITGKLAGIKDISHGRMANESKLEVSLIAE